MDIVERLRKHRRGAIGGPYLRQAADEIDRLRKRKDGKDAEIERLRGLVRDMRQFVPEWPTVLHQRISDALGTPVHIASAFMGCEHPAKMNADQPDATATVRYDLAPASVEGVIRDKLIALGWTPPADQPTAAQPDVCQHGIRSPWACDQCEEAAWQERKPADQPEVVPEGPSVDLEHLRTKLKWGEYDGNDIMHARFAIEELIKRRAADQQDPNSNGVHFTGHNMLQRAADQPGAVLPCPDGVWHECARAVCQSRMSCMDATLKAAEGHFRDRSGVLDAWLKAPTPCATEVEPADQPPAFDFQAATGQPCDQPGAVQSLSCEIRDGAIYIAIGSETVRLATNESPALYDGTRQTVVVSDSARWLKSVWHRLTEEDEDGSTPVSRMFDAAIERAVDQGDEGVDERAADKPGDAT